MPLTPLSDTSGFAPLSNSGLVPLSDPGFVSPESNPSLLESKQQQVTAISDAKKQALDPSSSIDPSLTSYNDLSVTDGDTLRNKLNGEIYRLTQGAEGDGFRYNTFESNHGDNFKTDPARMLAQKQAIAKVDGLPLSYIPDSAVLNRGEKAKDIFGKLLEDTGNISINPTGKIDKYGRTVAEAFAPGSDQSLLSPMNTSELNADYATKYNERQQREDRLKEFARREEATQFSVSDANRETLLGGIANAVAGGAVAASDQIYNMTKAPFELGQQLRERGITNKQRELSSALTIKQEAAGKAGTTYTPTAEEQAILETPTQAFMRETVRPVLNGERDITARDLLVGLTNVGPFQQNTHEKLKQSAFIKENITDRLTAYQEGARKIYNSGGSDELFKDSKALYTDSIEPTFVEGVQKFKGGHVIGGVVQKANEVDGVIQVADAIANAGVGIFRVAANNPQAVAEEIVKQIPNSIAASKALLQTFLGMYTNTASEVTTSFIKEHGRHPEGAEVDNIQINSALSAIADSYADKMIVSKPGVARAVVREGLTESGQSFLEQDAAKQGVSKIDFAEVYASGVIGSLAGGGTTIAVNPVEAIKEAGSAIASTGKTGLDLASKLVPDSVSQAFSTGTQAVTDAVGSTTQAVTDAIGEVNSSTSTSTVDPLKQSAQTQDSVEALKTLLRPENIISATSTPEDHKAFVAEASRHNAELAKEMFAITDPATAPTEENTARAKVLLTEFRKNKDVIDGIKAGNSVADTTDADLSIVATPDHPDTLQAVDRTIRSMRQPDKVSLEQAEAFQAKATLTPEQTSVVSAFIATKKASATMTEVNKDVIYGKPGFLGMVEHQAILSDALDQENIPAAQSALDSFKAFAASQVNKVDSLNAIVSAISTSNVEQVKELVTKFAKDFPTAQPLKLGKYEILKVLDKANGLELAKTSEALGKFQGLANNVGKEANMLTTAVAEAEFHFKLGTTEAKAVPVKQESGLLTPVGSEFPNAPSEYKIDNIDEMIATNGGVPAVSQFTDKGYQSVNFKDFHLSIDNENKSAEVAKVELGTEERGKGHGINAYKALGDALAERGITLTSSEAQYADGKNMWHKLVKQGHAVKKGSYFEYVPTKPAIESKPAPAVDPIVNEVTVDPVINNTAVDQVTTDTSGNAEEESVTDPVTIVADATVEDTADTGTTEIVTPLEQIKALATSKNYVNYPHLVAAVAKILAANSIEQYDNAQVALIINTLKARSNKPTSLGEYLLDSLRKFTGGKKLSDYYSAKILDKASKHSALLTTPNFFSALKDVGVKDALGLTPEQLNGLDALTGFVNKFADTFKASTFTPLMVDDAEVLNRNPALYFMKEGGRDFDENFVSTLATVAYSWVANNANSLIEHDAEGINSLLGRDGKHKVTDQELEILGDKQILKSALITSLGKEIASSLGLNFNPKADGAVESKMIEALGIYAVNTLDHMGVLAKSEAVHKDVYLTLKKGETATEEQLKLKPTGENIVYFTGVATEVTRSANDRYDVTELGKDVQAIVDDNRQSKGLLTELFGYAQQRALPLLEAPTLKNMPNIIKRGIKRIPERMRKALHKYASNGFTINMDNHAIYSFLEPEQRLQMLGYNESLDGVHAVNIKSVQGTNRTSKNEVEAYDQLIEHLDQQEGKLATPMYFLSSVWKSGRAGMEGLINPQASKFHRHMLGMAAWESTVDSPAKLKLFKIAVAEALGSKVDRQGDETSLEAFDRLRNQPEIRDGIATIKYLKSGVEMSAEEKLDAQEAILAAIEKGGSKTHTLEALTALATYSETEPFTTRMTKEVDGVTNGVIIGLIQLMSHRPEELLEFLKAGGLSKDKNFVYGEWIAKVGNFDNYQRMAHSLIGYKDAFYKEIVNSKDEAAKDRTKTANAFIKAGGTSASLVGLDFFVGALMKDDNLTKAARDLAKNPLMITSYGSAMKNVIEGLGKDIIANFYSKLEDASDNQEALDEIARQLNNILGTKHKILKTSYLLDVEDTNKNEALKFKLNKADTAKFQELVATSIGVAMSDAITEHFQPFIDKRKELNNAMNLVHAAFMIKYDAAYEDARKVKGSNLSREEVNALVKKLEPSMASFDHAMSDGEMDTELFVAKNESKTNLTDDYRVQVNSKKNLPHGPKSVSAHGSVSYFGFPGVGSVIKAIHSSDGAVQYKLMETSAVLNVHDADLAGIDGTMAMTQRQNLAFKEVMEDYSMRASIQKTLLRAMKELTPEEVAKVNGLLRISDDKAEGFLGHDFVTSEYVTGEKFTYPKYESIDAFIIEFTDTTRIDLAAKKELLASLKSWGQYNLNHGAYVTEEESEALFAAIEEMEGSLEQEDAAINAMVKEELAHMKKTYRDAINGQIKSSATEDIDTATFVADMSATVSAQTVESIFDQLGKLDNVTDSVSHTEHLRDILSTSIKQVLNPMEILVRKLGQVNSGVLAKGKIYLSMGNTSRLHTTDQSAQEVYAHELVHAVTETALSKDYWLHKKARSLYEKVQDQITPESFLDHDAQGNVIVPAGSTLQETIDKAKAVHDHIFDNNDITKTSYKNPITNEIENRQYSNGLLEFIAMGTTNAKFIKILAGINTNKSKRDPLTFADKVYNLFVGAINSVTSLINKTKDPAANVALMILMHKLSRANQVKSNIIMRKLEEHGHLEDIVNSKLYKVLAYSALKSGEILKARKNKTLSAVGEMIGLSQDTSFEAYKKVAGKLARRNGMTHKSFMAQLVTEAEGITAISALYMHMLSKSNKFIDQLRRLEAQSLTNQILGSFIAGTPSKSEGKAITKVLLKTDMGSLIDSGYTWDKMFGLLKSRSKRLAEIATVEQQLQAESPANFDYYKTQAASLGYMMVNGQPLKWGTKINAVNIAHLGGTGKTVEGNLEAIEKYVDILASLHAIKYSDAGHVTDFVTVAEREFAKDKDNNGVMLSYLAHKDLKARALEQSFEGQKELMFKGYTKEIYNPRVSIITAPSSMEAELKAEGYIKEREDMSKDPTDLNEVPMSLYVNKDGDTATFNKMIVSLTSNRRKGTDLAAGYSSIGELNPALLGYFDTADATVQGQKIFASKDYADLTKLDSHNLLVPVENAQHEVVGYRYLMNEATKDELLQKDNSFAKVLGAMEGSIVDKRESKKINNEVVNLMRKDFLDNYNKDPDLFVKFSPHSQDADERELYAMLPADMRKEIKKVWKSDVMYVRANMFRTIFGFRKFTVTEGSKEQDEMNTMHNGVLSKFKISLRDKLRTPTAKRFEIGLQEVAKEVKDAIVIKLGGTLYNNVISNNLLLWVKGVSRSAIVKDQAMFLDAARQYQKDLAMLKELERSVRINPKLQNSANVKAKINRLKDDMAVNPMAFLMDSAVSQTIIEDVDTDESQYTYKGLVEERLSKLTSGVPKPLKTLASVAYMTHDTMLYKFMREATQLSDLVARATLHKHNTEKKGMGLVESINDIKDTFIDYDAPTSKQIQYLNDTNFLMFTKFFIRSQKIIYQTYANAPARALSLLGFEEVFGEMSTINDSNIINTSILGKINNPLTLIDDLLVPHTVSLLDPTGAGGGSYTPQ